MLFLTHRAVRRFPPCPHPSHKWSIVAVGTVSAAECCTFAAVVVAEKQFVVGGIGVVGSVAVEGQLLLTAQSLHRHQHMEERKLPVEEPFEPNSCAADTVEGNGKSVVEAEVKRSERRDGSD